MMDHAEAVQKLVAEQYLLGELSEREREEFEQHFFSCSDCAEAVNSGTVLVANARAVLAEGHALAADPAIARQKRWSFWAGWRPAPAMAVAGWIVAAVLAGYQVLRGPVTGQLTLAPALAIRAVRSEQALTFSKQKGIIAFTVAHEWEENYSAYDAEIERAADHRVVFSSRMAEPPGEEAAPISVSIRLEGLKAGAYFLVLYGLGGQSAQKNQVERVSFTLTE
jgi:Putative zinc-finger